jgi:hypothetical protein
VPNPLSVLAAAAALTAAVTFAPDPSRAADPLAECKDFFAKFDTCVAGLEGEQQEEARIFVKTLKGTLGMADDLNRGDPMMTSILCSATMTEARKDPMVQAYKCAW